MENFFNGQSNPFIIYGGLLVVAFIFYFISRSINGGKQKRMEKDYLSQHPDAARIFLTSRALITSEAVQVHTVNDEYPVMFTEKNRAGFYAQPGNNIVEISYTHNRPGVMYKNVTKTTGAVKQEIEVESNKTYVIGFDRKEECFVFEEITDSDL